MECDLKLEILKKFWEGISNPFEGAAKIFLEVLRESA